MNQRLGAFLDELSADGIAHDAAQQDRRLKRRNLESATAELLSVIVRILGARQAVEIGTANGYSTVLFADAVRGSSHTSTFAPARGVVACPAITAQRPSHKRKSRVRLRFLEMI